MTWCRSWRADPRGAELADRHYSRQKVGHAQFVPPGRCLVLVTAAADALWVTSWPFAEHTRHRWAGAWVCSIFRNESEALSSDLIREAVAATRAEWPAVPAIDSTVGVVSMVTFVDEGKVRRKRDPGRCFRRAGFEVIGRTVDLGLLALGLPVDRTPAPAAAPGTQLLLEAV